MDVDVDVEMEKGNGDGDGDGQEGILGMCGFWVDISTLTQVTAREFGPPIRADNMWSGWVFFFSLATPWILSPVELFWQINSRVRQHAHPPFNTHFPPTPICQLLMGPPALTNKQAEKLDTARPELQSPPALC